MVKVKNSLVGQKFGRLTVLYQTDDYVSPNGVHYAQYRCICNCNKRNEIDVTANNLKNNHTLSCGCLHKQSIIKRSKKYNEYKIIGDIVYIKLSNCSEYTMVNLDKWNKNFYIREFYWRKSTNGYVDTRIPKQYVKQFNKQTIRLHQLICPCESGYEIDHIDRNRLNNLTNNLRPVNHSENNHNKNLNSNNTSGYTGVSWNKNINKWESYICVNNVHMKLGYYNELNDAIRARQEAENKYLN